MIVHETPEGVVVHGTFGSPEVNEYIRDFGPYKLVVADSPYGKVVPHAWDHAIDDPDDFADWMVFQAYFLSTVCVDRSAMYVWGGIGRPGFRPFYRFLHRCEDETRWNLANHITWKKRRAYGVQHNYLFTREELAYFVLGDVKKPLQFSIPLLNEKRGYPGYNKQYPAKSEYLRRTSVWTDITEIFRGKVHDCQKPVELIEIPIATHTDPEDIVLDPFAGSGTTAVAAIGLGRKFLLVEQKEEHVSTCLRRIEEALL